MLDAAISGLHHGAERQVDAGGLDFFGFGDAVEPVSLGTVLHDEQAAVPKENFGGDGEVFVIEAEFPRSSENQRSDGAIRNDRFLVIAVPAHAFVPLMVEVQQAGVEAGSGEAFREGQHFIMAGRQAQGTWNAALFSSSDGSLVHSIDTKKRITHARFTADGNSLILAGANGQPAPKNGIWPRWGRLQIYKVEV